MSRTCALCGAESAQDDLARVSGFDFCATCRSTDPTEALAALGIPVEWDTQMMRFCAGLGIPGQAPGFRLRCVPELATHKVWKLVSHEVEVGDPTFDARIYVRTSHPDAAAELLSIEGVQSALLSLLTDVRVNELVGNHVTLEGPTLTISMRPIGGAPPERIQELKLETAALALHLRARAG